MSTKKFCGPDALTGDRCHWVFAFNCICRIAGNILQASFQNCIVLKIWHLSSQMNPAFCTASWQWLKQSISFKLFVQETHCRSLSFVQSVHFVPSLDPKVVEPTFLCLPALSLTSTRQNQPGKFSQLNSEAQLTILTISHLLKQKIWAMAGVVFN